MLHSKTLNSTLRDREAWIFRRQKGIPNNKKLFVLACMDERLPLEEVLGLGPGDAHVFRNAGGLVTDDAIRSAALTIHFFDTREIIVVNHTECGMLSATGEEVTNDVEQKLKLNLSEVSLDPGLPNFKLNREDICAWWKMQTDIDKAAVAQAEAFRQHPLIPNDVPVTSYIYEVETGHLRTPGQIYSKQTAIAIADR